jgi:protoporphyrinogen oxidase
MIPYNLKLWRHHPKEMSCDWLDKYVPKPDLRQVIQGSIGVDAKPLGYNSYFYYPKEGGINSLIKALVRRVKDIEVCQEVGRISLNPRVVYTKQGEGYTFDILVSTMPIKELIKIIDNKPRLVEEAREKLKYVSLLNINLGISRKVKQIHWVYIPEKPFISYRIGVSSNFSAKMAPQGCSSIYTEISYKNEEKIDHDRAREKVVTDLVSMKIIREKSEVVAEKILDIPYAYVIYDKEREHSLSVIRDFLEKERIFSAGRYGGWKYSSMEDAVLDGKKLAGKIVEVCRNEMKSNRVPIESGGIV